MTPPPLPYTLRQRYRLLQPLGQGTHLYEGEDLKTGQAVVVRALALAGVPGARVRAFQVQQRALARSLHPHLLPPLDIVREHQHLYVVREPAAEGTLATWMASEGRTPIPPADGVSLAKALAEALQSLHERGIVHGHLQPATVLLFRGSQGQLVPRISDTGQLVRPTPEAHPLEQRPYMAPDAQRGTAPTPAADIYALGALLYQLLVGRPPSPPGTEAAGSVPLPLSGTALPDWLQALLLQMLHPAPAARPTAAQVVAALWSAGRPLASSIAPPTPTPRPTSQRSSRFGWGSVVALLLALLGATLFFPQLGERWLNLVRPDLTNQPRKVVSAAGAVALRSEPSTQGHQIDRLPPGTTVTLLGTHPSQPWHLIQHEGVVGWMAADYLPLEARWPRLPRYASLLDYTTPHMPAGLRHRARVSYVGEAEGLNLRAEPTTTGAVQEVLQEGVEVVILTYNSTHEWAHLWTPWGSQGWASTAYLEPIDEVVPAAP